MNNVLISDILPKVVAPKERKGRKPRISTFRRKSDSVLLNRPEDGEEDGFVTVDPKSGTSTFRKRSDPSLFSTSEPKRERKPRVSTFRRKSDSELQHRSSQHDVDLGHFVGSKFDLSSTVEEDVVINRCPGQKLGLGLKFEGREVK